MDFEEGIELSFDVYFAVIEFTLDASFDDDFNTGNTFFTDLLSTVGDLYAENSKTHLKIYHGSTTKKSNMVFSRGTFSTMVTWYFVPW
jgi:hypothetical protein